MLLALFMKQYGRSVLNELFLPFPFGLVLGMQLFGGRGVLLALSTVVPLLVDEFFEVAGPNVRFDCFQFGRVLNLSLGRFPGLSRTLLILQFNFLRLR